MLENYWYAKFCRKNIWRFICWCRDGKHHKTIVNDIVRFDKCSILSYKNAPEKRCWYWYIKFLKMSHYKDMNAHLRVTRPLLYKLSCRANWNWVLNFIRFKCKNLSFEFFIVLRRVRLICIWYFISLELVLIIRYRIKNSIQKSIVRCLQLFLWLSNVLRVNSLRGLGTYF